MLCSKFSILRPEKGFVIVDDSPAPVGPFGSMQDNPAHVLAAYGEHERDEAMAHLARLLDEEDADRAEEDEAAREAAADEPEPAAGRKVSGTPTPFDSAR